MDNEIKTTNSTADSVRIVGRLLFIAGIVLLFIAQFMEINVSEYGEIDARKLLELPKKIAEKTNFTLLGGLLIIVGLQLSLVSNQVISEIIEQFKRPIPTENKKEDLEDEWD